MNWRLVFTTTFLIGYGISLNDFAHQVWQLKGHHNLLEGGYIGFLLMLPYVIASVSYTCITLKKRAYRITYDRPRIEPRRSNRSNS